MPKLKSKIISFFAKLGLKFMDEKSQIALMVFNCRPSVISEIVILPVVGMIINKFTKRLFDLKEKGKIYKGKIKGKTTTIVPMTMGAPAAAVIMEALHETKSKYIIKVDFCGGLSSDMKVGDIVLADKAVCGDGTTPHYDPNAEIISANQDLLNLLSDYLTQKDIEFKKGTIYTTDAIFRETEDLLTKARNKKAIAIDMETSALYLLGELYGKKVISINVVSDIPDPRKKFNLNISSRLIDNTIILIETILEFISEKSYSIIVTRKLKVSRKTK
jgi:purine-nucleoside phosphorylase